MHIERNNGIRSSLLIQNKVTIEVNDGQNCIGTLQLPTKHNKMKMQYILKYTKLFSPNWPVKLIIEGTFISD